MTSRRHTGVPVLSLLGTAALMFGLLSPPASADTKAPPTGATSGVVDPCDQYLAIQVGTDGSFNEGAYPDPSTCGSGPSSFNLSYAWPASPWSSFTTVRVDGQDYVYGSSGSVISAPADTNSTTNESSWQVTPGVKASQQLSIVPGPSTGHPDTAAIRYYITNTDTVSHQVGLRVMIDTMLDGNDGAPFYIPGVGPVTTEREFSGSAIPQYWQAFYSLTSSSQYSSQGTLVGNGATPPDRFVIAAWPAIDATTYDYTVDSSRSVTSDSAVAAYWMPVTLAPGATVSWSTLYGLSGFTQDLTPPLALSVTGPASLSASSSGYSPNPFTITAFAQNAGTVTANAATLAISLPPGLSLASGETATHSVGSLPPNGTAQMSWQVVAAPQASDTTLTYSVSASATNASTKTVSRSITIPVAPGTGYVAMGDSYSSGEGLTPYLSGSATFRDKCHRSSEAYGPLLDDALGLGPLTFPACSGAVTQDFFTSNHLYPSEPAQISRLRSNTSVVTFTIGGDDAGFVDVLTKCIRLRPFEAAGYNCKRDKRLVSTVKARIKALEGIGTATTAKPHATTIVPIQDLLKRIHQIAPQATIEVAGYPHPFGSSKATFQRARSAPSRYACKVGDNGSFDYWDAQWINAEDDSLNASIEAAVNAVQSAGVPAIYEANVPGNFAGHGLCDSGVPWINGLTRLGFDSSSFHPTATGQEEGYEPAFSGLPSF